MARNNKEKPDDGSKTFTGLLDGINACVKNGRLGVGDLFEALNHRGFGPLMLMPALIVISPVGAIPGACAIFGGIIFLVSLQILIGKHSPWLPGWLKKMSFNGDKFSSGIKKIKPYAQKLDKFVKHRLAFLTDNDLAQRATALLCMVLSVGIMTLSLIPFAPAALALPIFLLGLGLTANDGAIMAGGYATLALPLLIMTEIF